MGLCIAKTLLPSIPFPFMLSEIFPKEDIPYETILCTVNNFPNSAVIGVARKKDKLFLKIFSETNSANNISKSFAIFQYRYFSFRL